MWEVDWSQMLVPSGSLAEIAIRGTVVYLVLFAAMRLLPTRTIGGMGPSDLLVLVVIADAVQNAMSDGYESLTEGLLLAAVIIGWATLIDWLDFRFPQLHIAQARPRAIIVDGRLIRRNMQRQQITEEEVFAQLRQHGITTAEGVSVAYVEGDGRFSIVLRHRKPADPPQPRRPQ